MAEVKPLNATMQKRIKHTAGAAIASGEVIVVGGRLGYYDSLHSAETGDIVDLVLEGPIEVAALSTLVLAIGDPVFWDAADNQVNADSVNNLYMGWAIRAKANAETVARIMLNDASPDLGGFMPNGVPQALSGAGAANLTKYRTDCTSTGGSDAVTLANGTRVGQLKRIQHIVDGGAIVLTPATFLEGTTITMADAGDYVILKWMGSVDGWSIVDIGNDADGATAPVVA